MKGYHRTSSTIVEMDDVDLIYASPFTRTQETAAIAGKAYIEKSKPMSVIEISVEWNMRESSAVYAADIKCYNGPKHPIVKAEMMLEKD